MSSLIEKTRAEIEVKETQMGELRKRADEQIKAINHAHGFGDWDTLRGYADALSNVSYLIADLEDDLNRLRNFQAKQVAEIMQLVANPDKH